MVNRLLKWIAGNTFAHFASGQSRMGLDAHAAIPLTDMNTVEELTAALEQCRETNRRLNRRCQLYKAGMEEKIEKGKAEYRNLGHVFANAAAEAYAQKLAAIEKRCREADCSSLSPEILEIIERPFSDDLESV